MDTSKDPLPLPPVTCSGVLFESLSIRRSFDGTTMRGNLTVKNYSGSEIKLALPDSALAKMVALMADELAAAASLTAAELRTAILQNS